MFLLDTDHVGIIQRRTGPEFARLTNSMAAYDTSDFFVAIVSFHEQVLGWHTYLKRAKQPQGVMHAYDMFLQVITDFYNLQTLPFDQAAADEFALLRKQRVRIGTMDLRIAAIALSRGLTVLSRNLSDFQQVPRLSVEDWTA